MSPPQPTNEHQEDIDDLDDLDDLLDDFSAPPKPTATAALPQPSSSARTTGTQDPPPQPATSFEDELSRNMAALFASLGSPPLATPAAAAAPASSTHSAAAAGEQGFINDDESRELQDLFQQLLKSDPSLAAAAGGDEAGLGGLGAGAAGNESLEALLASLTGSLGNPAPPQSQPQPQPQPQAKTTTKSKPSTNGGDHGAKLSFEETIQQTMNNMKASEQESRSAGKQDANDPLAALLASLNIDPSDLDLSSLNLPDLSNSSTGATGGGEPGQDFSGLLDGMMKQLMTKEILEEPLLELAEKYPAYLLAHRSTLPPDQYETYAAQSAIVGRIVQIFKTDGYSDEDSSMRAEVTTLMTKMQDLGSPPDEIMGEMPEGLDFGGEGCSIM